MIAALAVVAGPDPRGEVRRALGLARAEKVLSFRSNEAQLFDLIGGSQDQTDRDSVFFGDLDNASAMVAVLGLPRDSLPAQIYSAALRRWGDDAHLQLIGNYCAITALPGGRLRLARSPWAAPPLHYVCNGTHRIASSVLRVLFAAGHPREVDFDHLADQLLQDHHEGEPRGWYRGVGRVPLGCEVILGPEGAKLRRYYDPCVVPPIRLRTDADYLAAARELLDQAAGVAIAGARQPGIMLSGGLDSALAADAVLRHLPGKQRLPSFTFGPLPDWIDRTGPHHFGEEREFVRAFAAMHPQLEPHFPDSSGQDFDYRLRDLLAVCDTPTANVANVGIFHGPWEAAKARGCDVMLTADLGNFTISNDASWYSVEHLRNGHWRALWRALAGEPTDGRSLPRKFAALSLLPMLPRGWRDPVRHLLAGSPADWTSLASAVTAAARQANRQRRAAPLLRSGHARPRSRREWIMRAWHSADSGEDLDLGFEQLYGIHRRDVTAYRPLIEFCLGLPTDQFVRGNEHRRLARHLALGRMPEAQRLNPRYGLHHPDWHVRLGRRKVELAAYVERISEHPKLRSLIDVPRLRGLLAEWPADEPRDPTEALPLAFALTRAITAAMFVGYAEGRNDL